MKNEFYKEEQQDNIYLENKSDKENNQNDLFLQATQSPYTRILFESLLIDFTDTADISLMASLQKTYTLYMTN